MNILIEILQKIIMGMKDLGSQDNGSTMAATLLMVRMACLKVGQVFGLDQQEM